MTGAPESRPDTPAELRQRIAAAATRSDERDFDAVSWFWMILLGVIIPLALIVGGWLCCQRAG